MIFARSLLPGLLESPSINESRSFSRPISQLSEKAHRLGGSDEDIGFDEGFCTELDELNDTLAGPVSLLIFLFFLFFPFFPICQFQDS